MVCWCSQNEKNSPPTHLIATKGIYATTCAWDLLTAVTSSHSPVTPLTDTCSLKHWQSTETCRPCKCSWWWHIHKLLSLWDIHDTLPQERKYSSHDFALRWYLHAEISLYSLIPLRHLFSKLNLSTKVMIFSTAESPYRCPFKLVEILITLQLKFHLK